MFRVVRLSLFVTMLTALTVLPGLPTAGARMQDFGELVPIYDAGGNSIGQVSIYGIYDPFTLVEPGNDPDPGTHHVLIEVGFFNTGSAPLPYDPDGLILVDTNGFAYNRVTVNNLAADSMNFFTEAGTVEPGADYYGDNAYMVPDGAVIERVIYVADGIHLSAYDMRVATNAVGTAVSLNDRTGLPVGQATVVQVIDPFEAFDPAGAPAPGSRYVAVEVSIANQGQQAIPLASADFHAVDELGRLAEPAAVTLTDSALTALADGEIPAGGTVQGVLVFQVPEGSSIAQVAFAEGGTRDHVLADLDVAASLTDATGGCGGFVEWAASSLGAAGQVNTFVMNLQGANPQALDAGMLSVYYQQAESALEQVRSSVPPPAVESVHTYLIDEYLAPVTASLESLMNAVAAGDNATAQTALDEMSARLSLFSSDGEGAAVMAGLQTTCPEEFQELMTMGG